MSRGPLPSDLCLLSEIPFRKIGDKIRFLGCVISYNTGLGSYILGHRYPEGSDFTVTVDANLLKETLREQTTRVGEWLNVIGYITSCITTRGNEQDGVSNSQASVQALVIWPTGPLDVKQYEASFDGSDRQ